MPLYEYKCESCGKLLEVIQKFSDTPLATHEECGGALRRLISTPSLQFKGSGFYITDYGKGHNGKSSSSSGPSSDSKSDSKSESKSDSKSESKPASAPATKTETKSTTSSDSKS